ncbi:MAG: acyltransferase family protein [Deltaproteobacteria bacterium]|nr:acyltransferase family protein [Deltaproteobacteria bacterium]
MTKSVLGRDPFRRPSKGAAQERKKKTRKRVTNTRKRQAAAKNKQAIARKSSARPKKKPPNLPPEAFYDPMELSQEEFDDKEIDRIELLGSAETTEDPSENILQSSTRFVRPSFYGEKLGRVYMRYHAEEVDPFGFDPVYWDKVEPFFEFLFDSYWRVDISGIENIPDQNRVLIVGNHSGTVPYDGAMLKVAIENHHASSRPVRFLVEDFVFHFPFLGAFMNRIGGVRACQDNARRLLENEQLVVVFPEGVKGIGKLFRKRYKLQRFGRGGFIKLALRTGSPIVPVAIVGAEEIHPMLAKLGWLARPLGLPYLPVTPTFPLLGPLGAIPLPSKWMIKFGTPISYEQYSAKDAEDPLTVMQLSEEVRSTIQLMTDELLKQREHPFG